MTALTDQQAMELAQKQLEGNPDCGCSTCQLRRFVIARMTPVKPISNPLSTGDAKIRDLEQQLEAATIVCALCGSPAFWDGREGQQVWRHTGCERGSKEFVICDRYGYPIPVRPARQSAAEGESKVSHCQGCADWQARCTELEEIRRALTRNLVDAKQARVKAERERDGLLCVIHRDGGDYIQKRGAQKALEDASNLSLNRIDAEAELAEIKVSIAGCPWCSTGETPNLEKVKAQLAELAAIKGRREWRASGLDSNGEPHATHAMNNYAEATRWADQYWREGIVQKRYAAGPWGPKGEE